MPGCLLRFDEIILAQLNKGSSDVEGRLARLFPPGTPEQDLVLALQQQGFRLSAPCESDTQIHRAVFNQSGGGLFGPFPVFADVVWKVDELGHIVWTKAFVAYTGP